MVSRKRALGKARRNAAAKAKAMAAEEAAAFKTVSSPLEPFMDCSCTHGWNRDKYDESHECYKYIAAMVEHIIESGTTGVKEENRPQISVDDADLEWIASAFVSIGTGSVIHASRDFAKSSADLLYIRLGLRSVYYDEWIHQSFLNKSAPLMYNARLQELEHADQRRIISYLKKRIPCSCLDALYDQLKPLPKMGLCGSLNCGHPERKVEISKMWSCEACRRGHYCSKECQADHWLSHKEECKVWSEWEASHGSSSQTE